MSDFGEWATGGVAAEPPYGGGLLTLVGPPLPRDQRCVWWDHQDGTEKIVNELLAAGCAVVVLVGGSPADGETGGALGGCHSVDSGQVWRTSCLDQLASALRRGFAPPQPKCPGLTGLFWPMFCVFWAQLVSSLVRPVCVGEIWWASLRCSASASGPNTTAHDISSLMMTVGCLVAVALRARVG